MLEEQHENFVTAVTTWEMLAATNARWKWAAVQKIKVNENTYDISSKKRVTKKLLKFHVVVVQNNDKEMYKKCAERACKVAFLLIRPIVVFFTVLVAFAA